MHPRIGNDRTSTYLLAPALALSLAACNNDPNATGTETEGETETTGETTGGTETTVDPTVTPTTVDPTNEPTTIAPTSESSTEPTTDPTGEPTTGTTGDTDTDTDTDTGGGAELVSVWATANPMGIAADAIVGLTPALDAASPSLTLLGDVLSIQSVAITQSGDGVITFDAAVDGGVLVVQGLADNPQDGALGLGDRMILGPATGLKTPKGLEVDGPDGAILVADPGAAAILGFSLDDEGDVAPLFTVTELGSSAAVWDVHYDADSDTLYAAGTNGEVQVYEGFSNGFGEGGPDRTIVPTDNGNQVSVNLHGIALAGDTLYLSDVGDAMDATDGQLFVIADPAGADGETDVAQRIQGGALGNPVDLEVRGGLTTTLYVAEKSNDAVLSYRSNLLSGEFEQNAELEVPKPESVALTGNTELIVARNPAGFDLDAALAVDFPNVGDPGVSATLGGLGSVVSVQSLVLADAGHAYVGFDGPAAAGGGGVFLVEGLTGMTEDGQVSAVASRLWGLETGIVMPKGLALNAAQDRLFVADVGASDIKVFDAAATGDAAPLFVLSDLGGAAAWDIDYDDASDTLYAAGVDGVVRVFEGVLADEGAAGPTRVIIPADAQGDQVSVNLHGIQFDAVSRALLLSDVGDPMSDSDGRLFVIADADVADDAVEVLTVIGGDETLLGNPVDLAFDGANLYVAEKSNSVVLRYDGVLGLRGDLNQAEDVAIEVANAESVQLFFTAP